MKSIKPALKVCISLTSRGFGVGIPVTILNPKLGLK